MSKVAEEKRNWLDQVKADAEELTRKRLAEDLPKMEREIEARRAKAPGVVQPDVEEAKDAPTDEVAELKKQLKLERAARTRAEKKLNAEPSEEVSEDDSEPTPGPDDSEKDGNK